MSSLKKREQTSASNSKHKKKIIRKLFKFKPKKKRPIQVNCSLSYIWRETNEQNRTHSARRSGTSHDTLEEELQVVEAMDGAPKSTIGKDKLRLRDQDKDRLMIQSQESDSVRKNAQDHRFTNATLSSFFPAAASTPASINQTRSGGMPSLLSAQSAPGRDVRQKRLNKIKIRRKLFKFRAMKRKAKQLDLPIKRITHEMLIWEKCDQSNSKRVKDLCQSPAHPRLHQIAAKRKRERIISTGSSKRLQQSVSTYLSSSIDAGTAQHSGNAPLRPKHLIQLAVSASPISSYSEGVCCDERVAGENGASCREMTGNKANQWEKSSLSVSPTNLSDLTACGETIPSELWNEELYQSVENAECFGSSMAELSSSRTTELSTVTSSKDTSSYDSKRLKDWYTCRHSNDALSTTSSEDLPCRDRQNRRQYSLAEDVLKREEDIRGVDTSEPVAGDFDINSAEKQTSYQSSEDSSFFGQLHSPSSNTMSLKASAVSTDTAEEFFVEGTVSDIILEPSSIIKLKDLRIRLTRMAESANTSLNTFATESMQTSDSELNSKDGATSTCVLSDKVDAGGIHEQNESVLPSEEVKKYLLQPKRSERLASCSKTTSTMDAKNSTEHNTSKLKKSVKDLTFAVQRDSCNAKELSSLSINDSADEISVEGTVGDIILEPSSIIKLKDLRIRLTRMAESANTSLNTFATESMRVKVVDNAPSNSELNAKVGASSTFLHSDEAEAGGIHHQNEPLLPSEDVKECSLQPRRSARLASCSKNTSIMDAKNSTEHNTSKLKKAVQDLTFAVQRDSCDVKELPSLSPHDRANKPATQNCPGGKGDTHLNDSADAPYSQMLSKPAHEERRESIFISKYSSLLISGSSDTSGTETSDTDSGVVSVQGLNSRDDSPINPEQDNGNLQEKPGLDRDRWNRMFKMFAGKSHRHQLVPIDRRKKKKERVWIPPKLFTCLNSNLDQNHSPGALLPCKSLTPPLSKNSTPHCSSADSSSEEETGELSNISNFVADVFGITEDDSDEDSEGIAVASALLPKDTLETRAAVRKTKF